MTFNITPKGEVEEIDDDELVQNEEKFDYKKHRKELELLVTSLAGSLNSQYDMIVDKAVQAFGKFLALNASPLSDNGEFRVRESDERADLCDAAISAFVAMRRYLGRCRTFEEGVFAKDCCEAILRSLSLMGVNREFVFYAVSDKVERLLFNEYEYKTTAIHPKTADNYELDH